MSSSLEEPSNCTKNTPSWASLLYTAEPEFSGEKPGDSFEIKYPGWLLLLKKFEKHYTFSIETFRPYHLALFSKFDVLIKTFVAWNHRFIPSQSKQ